MNFDFNRLAALLNAFMTRYALRVIVAGIILAILTFLGPIGQILAIIDLGYIVYLIYQFGKSEGLF